MERSNMKKRIVGVLAVGVVGLTAGEARAAWTANDLPGSCVDMSFVGNTTGFAAISSGIGGASLYRTTTGASWSKVTAAGFPAAATSIAYIDAGRGHAVAGSKATTAADAIARTLDGGATWTPRPITLLPTTTGTNVALSRVSFATKNAGVAVGTLDGARGFVAITKNGGDTWTEIEAPASTLLGGAVMISADDIVLAGAAPPADALTLWSSHDGGASFTVRYQGDAVGAGQSWSLDSVGGSTYFLKGCGSPAGNAECVLKSTNVGDTWTSPSAAFFGGTYRALAFSDAMHGIAAGAIGTADVRVTSDGGQTWTAAAAVGGIGGPLGCAAYPGPAAYAGTTGPLASIHDPALGGGPRPPIPGAEPPDGGTSSSASSSGASSGGSSSSSSSGASSGASSSSSSSGASSGASGAGPGSSSGGSDDGCGCAATGAGPAEPMLLGAVSAVALALLRRRRR